MTRDEGVASMHGVRAVPRTFDMHADTVDALAMVDHVPYTTLSEAPLTGSLASSNAQVSVDRMGGLPWAQCYAIWIPDAQGTAGRDCPALDWYREAVAWFKGQMRAHADRITQVRNFSEIPAILAGGKVAAVLTVENAACLDAGLGVVDEFCRDGVLIAGVTWNGRNVLGSGNDFPQEGLSQLGRAYIVALEERGIVVDVSHLNERGFWELERVATKPYVATHSNAQAVCNHPRNLTDDQFRAIAEHRGLVGLNLHEEFVREGGGHYGFDELAAHVEHWLDLDGLDVVALGTDRDGATIPAWLADCSLQGALFECFVERFGVHVADKLFFENAWRFCSSLS